MTVEKKNLSLEQEAIIGRGIVFTDGIFGTLKAEGLVGISDADAIELERMSKEQREVIVERIKIEGIKISQAEQEVIEKYSELTNDQKIQLLTMVAKGKKALEKEADAKAEPEKVDNCDPGSTDHFVQFMTRLEKSLGKTNFSPETKEHMIASYVDYYFYLLTGATRD